MTERDTKFQGFANLLWDDLLAELDRRLGLTLRLTPTEQQIVKDVFAQRAYDLAVHIVEKLDASPLVTLDDRIGYHEKFVNEVPDMTDWP